MSQSWGQCRPSGSAGARCRAALACFLLATGCASTVWYGRSPDRRERVAVMEVGARQRLERDGAGGPQYDGIALGSILYGAGGRLAYAGQRGGRWHYVVDGVEGPAWDGIGEAAFSDDGRHFAYAVDDAGRWRVVLDGDPGRGWDSLVAHSLRFAGARVLYAGARGGKSFVTVGLVESAEYDGVGTPVASADGAHVAFAARRGSSAFVVMDRAEGGPVEAVGELALDVSGKLAFAFKRDGAWWVSNGVGGELGPYPAVRDLSQAAGHLVFIAGDAGGESVVSDGKPGRTFRRITRGPFVLDDGRVVYAGFDVEGQWVMAEGREPAGVQSLIALEVRGAHYAFAGPARVGSVVSFDGHTAASTGAIVDVALHASGRGAYVERHKGETSVVIGSFRVPVPGAVPGTLCFGNSGRWGVLVANGRGDLALQVEGEEASRPFDLEEVAAELMRVGGFAALGPAPAALVRRWVATEIDLAPELGAR